MRPSGADGEVVGTRLAVSAKLTPPHGKHHRGRPTAVRLHKKRFFAPLKMTEWVPVGDGVLNVPKQNQYFLNL